MQTIEVFIALLRAGVTGVAESNISDVDWKEVELLATKQGVLPIVFDGYQRYFEQKGLQAPVEIKLGWYAAAQQAERNYASHVQAIKTLTGYLSENGIQTIVLKGVSLSFCYPKPEHRICGDIDIYQFGDWKKADELLEHNAHVEIDRTHHHHTVYRWNGVSVENHYDFVNQYSHKVHKPFESYLKRLASELEHKEEQGVLVPAPTLHALFMLIHSGSEFSATAISIRQLTDWYLLCKRHGEEMDWSLIENVCKETGFDRFLSVWNRLASALFEGGNGVECLDAEARRVLYEILYPKYESNYPKGKIALWWFKIKRWWHGRWKIRLVYTKENLFSGFFVHLYSHLLRPEKMLAVE